MKTIGFARLSNADIDEKLLILCDLRWDYEDMLTEARAAGLWWVAPFARTYAGDLIGERLQFRNTPNPVELVSLASRQVMTLSSSTATFVPRQLIATPMSEPTWDGLSQVDDGGWDKLGVLHKKLGGRATNLALLRQKVADGTGKAQCAGKNTTIRQKKAAIVALLKELDPEARGILDYIQAIHADDDDAQFAPGHSAFDAQGRSLAFVWHLERNEKQAAQRWAEEVIRQPLHLDAAAYGDRPSLFPNPAIKSLDTYRRACALLEKHAVFGAMCKAIREDGYNGEAHFELARRLRREGRNEDAFHALINAAYFEGAREEAFTEALALTADAPQPAVHRALVRWKKA